MTTHKYTIVTLSILCPTIAALLGYLCADVYHTIASVL